MTNLSKAINKFNKTKSSLDKYCKNYTETDELNRLIDNKNDAELELGYAFISAWLNGKIIIKGNK